MMFQEKIDKLMKQGKAIREKERALHFKARACTEKIKEEIRKQVLKSGVLSEVEWAFKATQMPHVVQYYTLNARSGGKKLAQLLKDCPTSAVELFQHTNSRGNITCSIAVGAGSRRHGVYLRFNVSGKGGREAFKGFVQKHGLKFDVMAARVREMTLVEDCNNLIDIFDTLNLSEYADGVRQSKKKMVKKLKKKGLVK